MATPKKKPEITREEKVQAAKTVLAEARTAAVKKLMPSSTQLVCSGWLLASAGIAWAMKSVPVFLVLLGVGVMVVGFAMSEDKNKDNHYDDQ